MKFVIGAEFQKRVRKIYETEYAARIAIASAAMSRTVKIKDLRFFITLII